MVDEIEHRYPRKLQSFWISILLSFDSAIECSAVGQPVTTSIDRMGKVSERRRSGRPHYSSGISMNWSDCGNISVPSKCCGSGMRCILGGEMAVSSHFGDRTHWHAWMDAKEMSEPPISVAALRKSLVLNDNEIARMESLPLLIWKLRSR